MAESIKQKLSKIPAAQLVEIVLAALDTMGETEQINFITRYVDARISLTRLGADDAETFLNEVEVFCLDCLNGTYYSSEDDIEEYFLSISNNHNSSYYNDEWDYDEYYSHTEWAETFSRLLKLSMMYIRSGDISTGYEANTRLLSCLKETMSSDDYLGIDSPMPYISVDWGELFTLHYDALFLYYAETDQAIEKAFHCWMSFGDFCTEGFLSNVKDITTAEQLILDALKSSCDWISQRRCFGMLEQLYARLGLDFDKTSQAEALISCNVYFYLFVVDSLCEQACWQHAAETAHIALEHIPMPASDTMDRFQRSTHQEIRAAIQANLVDAYENLADFERAFNISRHMFKEAPTFDLYKRARGLAEKGADVLAFLMFVERQLNQKEPGYLQKSLLLNIYSHEGEIQKMLNMALLQNIDQNYYDRKYIALSLIYRALNGAMDVGESLSEYLTRDSEQDGIADMLIAGDDSERQAELLLHGVDLLRGIIAFHIDAANRSRYAKAAYYMRVMRDIFIYMQRENEFLHYFKDIIIQNNRRPALRDEMSIIYGKEATIIKK